MEPAGSSDILRVIIDDRALQALIDSLSAEGFAVIAPSVQDGTLTLGAITSVDELPAGVTDEHAGGKYRLHADGGKHHFAYAATPQGFKRYLYPPAERLWRAKRDGTGYRILPEEEPVPRYAFIGVRGCDLQALAVLDAVFNHGRSAEARYVARRDRAFIVAVNCTHPGETCFCTSMGTGPAVGAGADLVLTEFGDNDASYLLAEARSKAGRRLLSRIGGREAGAAEVDAANAALAEASIKIRRRMAPDAADVLKRNLEHREWEKVAERCLGCANCTLVCPTCFCASVEDVTDLTATTAERWRRWDSCFTSDFSYIHGGSIRRSGMSRYRQWITHKLSHWWQQFGSSGCVGCGRCITWCPVGIDITEEVQRIKESEGGLP
jgi:ferredoxin